MYLVNLSPVKEPHKLSHTLRNSFSHSQKILLNLVNYRIHGGLEVRLGGFDPV